jgi:phosphoribosylamine--glycine ligase
VKILVAGGGGREHALVWKLNQSPAAERIFVAPGNAGTEELAENVPIRATDIAALLRFAKEHRIDLTVIGPDDPLAAGIVDEFEAAGLRVFGPNKAAARLESSKIFAKQLMQRAGIPTAKAGTFEDAGEAVRFCERAMLPLVVKADGLALGKGVVIAQTLEDARAAITTMMSQARFGDAGRRVVIEEFLAGWECSVHALVSGNEWRMLATARDHKRALDGDRGANTGGMGAISPAELWDETLQRQFDERVMQPLLAQLDSDGIDFRGLLFPGLMITKRGPQVLEFNARFGDPETEAILPRLESDLLGLMGGTVAPRLGAITLSPQTAVTVVMASGGYPGKYETGKMIEGLEEAAKTSGVVVFHAGTRRENGRVFTAGGRVLAVTALADTAELARKRAYEAVGRIQFDGCQYRRDIAAAVAAR